MTHTPSQSTGERGQAMVEFAIVAPVLLLLVLGCIQIGQAFVLSGQLHAAVSEGARRGVVSATADDPAGEVEAAARNAADLTGMTIDVDSSWQAGEAVTVTGTVPWSLEFFGLSFAGPLTAERTMMVSS